MRMRHHSFTSLCCCLLFGALALVACGKKGGMPPFSVEEMTLETSQWQPQVEADGDLLAMQGAVLEAEAAGRVTHIAFTPGTEVAAGALLFELNPESARAQADLAQKNYERSKELFAKKVLAQSDLDQAYSNWQVADATLKQVIVRAPFAGRVGLNQVQLGDYVAVGTPLVSLQTVNPMQVDFRVPEGQYGQMHVGDGVEIRTPAYPKEVFHGKITGVDTYLDPDTRTLGVRAMVENADAHLLSGGYVKVTVLVGQPQSVIRVPQDVIVSDEKGNYVYIIQKNVAKKVPVILGDRIRDDIIVLKGLKVGETIVSVGQFKLQDGAPVLVVNKNPSSSAAKNSPRPHL